MCDHYGADGTKLQIDIEDINKRGHDLMNRRFVRPTPTDVDKLSPLILEIVQGNRVLSRPELINLKKKYKFYGKSSFLFEVYIEMVKKGILSREVEDVISRCLIVKEVKDWSGVVNVTLFTSPYPEYVNEYGDRIRQTFSCSHSCSFCPNDPSMPRSYLLLEPATLRAARNNFDAVDQMHDRLYSLYITGHRLDKIEVNVIGGTWSSYPRPYQEEFIRDVYYACNIFWDDSTTRRQQRLTLSNEKTINETAKVRVVQLVVETRPDAITPDELKFMRYLSVTRVQLGIQHFDDDVLRKVNRKCTTDRTIQAIELCKSIGMKIDGHFMPNLPFSSPKQDRDMLIHKLLGMSQLVKREVKHIKKRTNMWQWLLNRYAGTKEAEANDGIEHWEIYNLTYPELQVDQCKIYPTAVTIFTDIEKWYKDGTYVPYDERHLVDILIDFKSLIFPWIRINRIMRDFYADNIFSKTGANLALRCELVDIMKKEGKRCNCIRCRECKNQSINMSDTIMVIRKYNASNGFEYFISIETPDKQTLFGFVRLRLDNARNKIFPELDSAALVREAHVYSTLTEIGRKGNVQHNGLGTRLMKKAEQIAIENRYTKIAVISSVGSRSFYTKIGYHLAVGKGEYMIKCLK